MSLLAVETIDVNAVGDEKGWTALMAAAFHGHTEIVTSLLKVKGIEVNATNEDGWTAIMWAARHGHLGVIAALLATKGVDVNGAAHAAAEGGVTAQQMGGRTSQGQPSCSHAVFFSAGLFHWSHSSWSQSNTTVW